MDESSLRTETHDDVLEQEARDLNNFRADVAGGYRRTGLERIPEMLTKKDPGRRMGKSIIEYWRDVDDALAKTGVDAERVKELQRQIRSIDNNRGFIGELNTMLAPVYVYLRRQGYSRKDLWT